MVNVLEGRQVAPRPHPMPGWLEPVFSFVNTIEVELGTDELAGGSARLGTWLTRRGLVADGVRVTAPEYRLALDLRAGLRDLALRNNGVPLDDSAAERIDRTLRRLPLVVSVTTVLKPVTDRPVRRALSVIAAGYGQAQASGEWHRLRRCPADDCAWVFWDSSPQASRRWCTMRVCGNRAKVRAFTARRLATR